MKLHFDPASDAVYFRLDDSRIVESEEVRPGFVLDYNDKDQVVGFEILGASKRVASNHLKQVQFDVA